MSASLDFDTFSKYVNQAFSADPGNSTPIELQLSSARQLEVKTFDRRYEDIKEGRMRAPFSLIFHGPAQMPLPQQMYTFTHPEMGTFVMSIVPVGIDENGRQYEALFN